MNEALHNEIDAVKILNAYIVKTSACTNACQPIMPKACELYR